MKFILGQKIEMSQIFQDDGNVVPVSIVKAGPCAVTQIKTEDKEKYEATQIGFGYKKRLTKPELGHLKGSGKLRWLREFKIQNSKFKIAIKNSKLPQKESPDNNEAMKQWDNEYKIGDKIEVSIFKIGDIVQVSGISKGKGFQGVVRRHHFHGHPKTHGHKDQERMPGSIGSTAPQRVFKGTRMAGQMGNERVTVKGLEIIKIDTVKNLLYLKGAVPGHRGSLLEIKSN